MDKVIESQNPKSIVLTSPDSGDFMYVDGIHNIQVSHSITKVSLFRVQSVDSEAERRTVVSTLAMPTVALLEFCRNMIESFDKNDSIKESMLADIRSKMFNQQS